MISGRSTSPMEGDLPVELLTDNWEATLDRLTETSPGPVLIISPFLTDVAVPLFRKLRDRGVGCRLITRLNKADFWQHVSSTQVLLNLLDLGVVIKTPKRLHAKAYFFGGDGIITSANLTSKGVSGNYEMGLRFTKTEYAAPFEEADRLWASLKVEIDRSRVEKVAGDLMAFAARQPEQTKPDLPEELADEGEDPDEEPVGEIKLRPGVTAAALSPLLESFKKGHRQVRTGNPIKRLERELDGSACRTISLRTYLWLLGWCNTDPVHKKTGMERAQKLATALFGYIPPEELDLGAGRRYLLKSYRDGRPISFAEDIVAMHRDHLSGARGADTSPSPT